MKRPETVQTEKHEKPKMKKKAVLSRLLPYLMRYKYLMLGAILLTVGGNLLSLAGPYISGLAVDAMELGRGKVNFEKVGCYGVLMVVMYAISAALSYALTRLMIVISRRVVNTMRHDVFQKLSELPVGYFDTHQTGDILSRISYDIDTINTSLTNDMVQVFASAVTVIGALIMMLSISPTLVLVFVFTVPLSMFMTKKITGFTRPLFRKRSAKLGELNGFVEEMTAGQRVEKVFNHEKQDLEEFLVRNEKLRKASTNALTWSGMLVPVNVSMSYFNYGVSAAAGGIFALTGHMDLGTLASYLVYVRQSAMPLNQFTNQFHFLLAALSGAERIFDLMEQEPEIDEGTVTLCPVEVRMDGSLKETENYTGSFAWKDADSLTLLQGDVRFDQVVFGYTEEHKILDGISLFAKPGQKIAFVGSTGAGKTTIINLINRFYEIQSGTITYDGIDIRRIKKDDLRKSLSMVIQDTHLFTGTIADNIRYGRLNATEDEVREAAKIANADSFIRRLPKGYDTILHSDGSNLSQGQRQLLAIARAAISRPPVLILDEATSSIDTRTERLIEKGMDRLMENRTVFVIAHRLSTVRNAKAILVLEKGTIIERGDHEELLGQKGRYYQLYTGQFELE